MTVEGVEGFIENHRDLATLISSLGTSNEATSPWMQPTGCPGWRVRDLIAHISSSLKELVDPSPADQQPPPQFRAEQKMEVRVADRRDWDVPHIIAEYHRYFSPAVDVLRSLQTPPADEVVVSLSELGSYARHLLADAYCFDVYCHVRHDLLPPRGPLCFELLEPDKQRLQPAVTWIIAGIPQMCAEALQLATRPWSLVLDDGASGSWTFHPAQGAEAARIAPGDKASTKVRSGAHSFVSWSTRRSSWRNHCVIDGPVDDIAPVLDALNVI